LGLTNNLYSALDQLVAFIQAYFIVMRFILPHRWYYYYESPFPYIHEFWNLWIYIIITAFSAAIYSSEFYGSYTLKQ